MSADAKYRKARSSKHRDGLFARQRAGDAVQDQSLSPIEKGGTAVKKVHLVEVGLVEAEAQRLALPDHVQLAMVEIAESAREGLLALAVGAGFAVLHECMEHEVEEVVGPRGRHDRGRTTKRHGHVGGEVTLGGRRVPISRPRVRSADDSAEIALEPYAEFARRDLLERVALERMLARVSTRRGAALAPVLDTSRPGLTERSHRTSSPARQQPRGGRSISTVRGFASHPHVLSPATS